MALLTFLAAADVRRFRAMVWLIIAGHIVSEVAVAAVLIWGDADRMASFVVPITGAVLDFQISVALIGSMVLDGVIIVLLLWLYISAERAAYHLKYLTPVQYNSLLALSEVLIEGDRELVQPEEMGRNADRYLAAFRARNKWIFKLVLSAMEFYPLLSLNPPLSTMHPESRRLFLEDRFYRKTGWMPGFWKTLTRVLIRISKQLAYLGYYSNPKTFDSVGYVRFDDRIDTPARKQESPVEPAKPLQVQTDSDFDGQTVRGDIIIIGSGAGAAIVASGILREQPDRSIVMIERGDYVPPSEMNDDEIDMLSKMYADGALQLSRDFNFQVLQGSCVGGTTVINNAVCFDLPDEVLETWNNPTGLNAGLPKPQIDQSHKNVRSLVSSPRQPADILNPGAQPFIKGIRAMNLDAQPNEFEIVEAHIQNCYGCGYCNIGCRYGKKLSMLDKVLPKIQSEHPGQLRIIAGCTALKLRKTGKRITRVECKFSNGKRINVEGNVVVVAAGAVSSSILLLKSGLGGNQTGKHLSFNMGSPLTGIFKDVQNSYAGLQISHYLKREPSQGYLIETWFNPPVAQALTMPGWSSDHFNNMLRYDRMSSLGVLVPTASNGEVRAAGVFGRDIKYKPKAADLEKLAEGLILAGTIFLEGGAESVMPHTIEYLEWTDRSQLDELRSIVLQEGAITLGTGHPQGGNIICANAAGGVVDPECRVHGIDNLYITDASVFPSAIGVNPQMTVMALAD
ncbi:MAG: GMC family oxidoreductase N-terminal domain-containing protein, partial [Rhodothermia bacterium]